MGIASKAAVWVSLFAAVVAGVYPNGVCAPDGSNKDQATCCKVDGKYCTQIQALTIANVTNGVCVWNNLAGQTPDANAVFNAPWVNNFACGGTSGNCNYESTAKISSDTGTPYYGLVTNLSNIVHLQSGAANAAEYYKKFNVALSRYNCEEQYSHWNCDDCRKAYARWACAMMMPACTYSPCGSQKPCVRVCNEVVRKCPVTLGFTCPDDNRDYSDSGCNLMGLTAGVDTARVSIVTMTTAIVAVFFATWH